MPKGDEKPSVLAWHAGNNCAPDFAGTWAPVQPQKAKSKGEEGDTLQTTGLKKEEVDITVSEIMGKTTRVAASHLPGMDHHKVPLRELKESDFRLPRWFKDGLKL